MPVWGDTTEEDETSGEEAAAAVVALMARSKTYSDDEPVDSLSQHKEKVRGLKKAKLE